MSTPNPSHTSVQSRTAAQARQGSASRARAGDAAALARIRAVRPDGAAPPRPLKLADAQLAVAREAGFESWPKLVADLQERDVKAFGEAVQCRRRQRRCTTAPRVAARPEADQRSDVRLRPACRAHRREERQAMLRS